MLFERGYFSKYSGDKSMITRLLRESREFSIDDSKSNRITVFLSHKHSDLNDEEVAGVISMLNRWNTDVYIDSLDNKLPNQTSRETAEQIKEKIYKSNKFILLATPDAITSNWCNWELGVGDIYKFPNDIAIIPIKERYQGDRNYIGQEYLEIYPYLYEEGGAGKYTNGEIIPSGLYILNPKTNKIKTFEKWLR